MKVLTPQQLSTTFGSLPTLVPRVVVSGNMATPSSLVGILDANIESYRLFSINACPALPDRADVTHESPFIGPALRAIGRFSYLPMRLSMVPALFRSTRHPDVVLVSCSPPRGRKVSLGIEVNIVVAAIEAARERGALVVAQINSSIPYLAGDGEIDLDQIDLAVEIDEPLPSARPRPVSDADREIGRHVVSLVGDGATLQIGIGAVPDAVAAELVGRRGLKVRSEAVSDGIMQLDQAGALDQDVPIIASFLIGSSELYDWAASSGRVLMQRTETVNDPGQIAAVTAMTSINTAFEIDLYAQSVASYRLGTIYSGLGGQPDFTTGAMHSRGGQAIIALPSWHGPRDASRVIPVATTPVSSFQHSAIVTDQGIAPIFGHSQRAQARLLISQAADPRARDELWAQAGRLGLTD